MRKEAMQRRAECFREPVFKALTSNMRVKILDLLARKALSLEQLRGRLEVGRVSFLRRHLGILINANLVLCITSDNTQPVYRLTPFGQQVVLHFMPLTKEALIECFRRLFKD